jgi:hypothetical protein
MKIYLRVPFKQHLDAKRLGAHWDPARKRWFVISTEAYNACHQWRTNLSPEQNAWLKDKVRLAKYDRKP